MARGGVWIGIIYFICFEGIGINHRKRFHSAEKQGDTSTSLLSLFYYLRIATLAIPSARQSVSSLLPH